MSTPQHYFFWDLFVQIYLHACLFFLIMCVYHLLCVWERLKCTAAHSSLWCHFLSSPQSCVFFSPPVSSFPTHHLKAAGSRIILWRLPLRRCAACPWKTSRRGSLEGDAALALAALWLPATFKDAAGQFSEHTARRKALFSEIIKQSPIFDFTRL